jgi:hypothetical protein
MIEPHIKELVERIATVLDGEKLGDVVQVAAAVLSNAIRQAEPAERALVIATLKKFFAEMEGSIQ